MSENDLPVSVQPQVEHEEESLKYLNVVQTAAQNAVPYASKVYDYAKGNSGSLKPAVETTEGAVKTVVSPAIDTFHDIPANVLKFADSKVAESVSKAKSSSVASDIKNVGVVETAFGLTKTAYTKIEPTAKELLVNYKPVADSALESLNKVPLFRSVANAVVPTDEQQTSEEGEKVSKISAAVKIKEGEEEPEEVVSGGVEGAVVAPVADLEK